MIIRKITIIDHSPEHGDLDPRKVLDIEIKGDLLYPKSFEDATQAICNSFKHKVDHSILVEDISSTNNVVYSKAAWK